MAAAAAMRERFLDGSVNWAPFKLQKSLGLPRWTRDEAIPCVASC
jgi:hypothetical protein